jgi:molecular chaperone GrpE
MGEKKEILEDDKAKTPKDEATLSTNENIQEDNDNQEQEYSKKLEECKKELESLNDKYLRAHAEFENIKKRLEREKSTAVVFANETFVKDLLSVLDSFDGAISSMKQIEGNELVEKIKEGVIITYEQLIKVLKKHGVEEISNVGQFDPNVHQVIQQIDSEGYEKDDIVNTLQKGYKLKDRVIRPSMVITKK